MTLAIAVVTIPRIYSRWINPGWAPLVVVAGSYTTGRSLNGPDTAVHNLSGSTASLVVGTYSKAMRVFAVEYGPAFYGGIVAGLAGGIIVAILVRHHRVTQLSAQTVPGSTETTTVRPMKPWIPVTMEVTVLVGILAYLASLRWQDRPLRLRRPSALTHQFRRLERDIGATLYQSQPEARPIPARSAFDACRSAEALLRAIDGAAGLAALLAGLAVARRMTRAGRTADHGDPGHRRR